MVIFFFIKIPVRYLPEKHRFSWTVDTLHVYYVGYPIPLITLIVNNFSRLTNLKIFMKRILTLRISNEMLKSVPLIHK